MLSGRLADRARSTILAIADEISDVSLDPSLGPKKVVDLAHGKAGRAIFFHYLARVTGNEGFTERSHELLGEALDALATTTLFPSLYYGFAGVAWAYQHVDAMAELEPIDEALLEHVSIDPWEGRCDVTVGLAGHGVYFASRPQSLVGDAALDRIERHLVATARSTDDHVWWPLPSWLAGQPIDIGSAGNGGIASFLASSWPRLGAPARALLPKALSWIWDELDPSLRAADSPIVRWCEPSIAIAMLQAARRLASSTWWDRGMLVARNLARSSVVDASFYRGAAGVAHMLYRIHRATGDTAIEQSALTWYARLLDARTPGQGIAGYRAMSPDTGQPTAYPGITLGAAGIGLVLLAATSEIDPAWDSAFQFDL